MSSDKRFLALYLVAPLQSWGISSQYNHRNSALMPTKSGIAGMCCAALGLPRGSSEEQEFLKLFLKVRMTSIAIPRLIKAKELQVRRLQDYHTVGGGYCPDNQNERQHITTSAGTGKPKTNKGQSISILTHRQYLTDAAFGILLEGNTLLDKIAEALINPKWGIWLGRKSCIPSAPIFSGIKNNQSDALALLIGEKPLEAFTRQVDCENFSDGRDSLPDEALSFDSAKRQFSPRRVRTWQAGEL